MRVRSFLISNAVFWFEKYHVDGIRGGCCRVHALSGLREERGEWIPTNTAGTRDIGAAEFLKQLNSAVYEYFPGIMMIAEESTTWPMGDKTASHRWSGVLIQVEHGLDE